MAHQFKPVDRDTEMLLPHNMLDWVPEGHAVRVVIAAVERLMTGDLAARLVPPSPKGSAAGPARYDPVMLLTVWMYAYLRGVLSTRAVEDRCRYDATFRVACGRAVPDHRTLSRRTCSAWSSACARARGWAGFPSWPATGSRSQATPRRKPAGPRPGCA